MYTKLFHRLSYLLCLFQITCFAALQRIPLHSSSFSDCSDAHKKIDIVCNTHSEELQIEPKNLGNELLVYGFIREFKPEMANKIIPHCIMNLCVDFSRRMLPCDCIKRKYREILPQLDTDECRKKALIFFLMHKIEDVQDGLRRTILHYACKDGNLGLAKLLRKWGANLNATDKYGNNALHRACESSDNVAMVKWLLDECKIGIETKGYWERTPFLCAAKGGQLEIAKLLKKQGANINSKDEDGYNALHFSCLYSDSVPTVTWLLDECKLGLETEGYYEKTPFLCAAWYGRLEIAKLLKERGANIHAKDKDGNNALDLACYFSGSVAMIEWLLDVCKIDIESKGKYGITPFLSAAYGGQLKIAQLLKQRGANINAKDTWGYNALDLAKSNENKEKRKKMIDYLKSQSQIKTGRCFNFWPKRF